MTTALARPDTPTQACWGCLCVIGLVVVGVLALRPGADGRFDPLGGIAFAVRSIAGGIAAMVIASLAGGTMEATASALTVLGFVHR